MRTDDLASFVFGKRQDLRECFLACVGEEFVVGHMDLPRLVCSKHCRPAERALPPLRLPSGPSRIIFWSNVRTQRPQLPATDDPTKGRLAPMSQPPYRAL